MSQTWKEVWAKRALDPHLASKLSQLLAADGYDTGFGSITESHWRDYVMSITSKLGVTKHSSVYEVGSGAGAFLYPLQELGCRVGGLDYSAKLLQYAQAAMTDFEGDLCDASELQASPQYDYVLSSGVFFYFESLDYAAHVLSAMIEKAVCGVAVLDIPSLEKKENAIIARRKHLTDAEYDLRYEGLEHLYFEPNWFVKLFKTAGLTDIRVEPQNIKSYANSAYRFNVLARKAPMESS